MVTTTKTVNSTPVTISLVRTSVAKTASIPLVAARPHSVETPTNIPMIFAGMTSRTEISLPMRKIATFTARK
jgi:hypothetical protein